MFLDVQGVCFSLSLSLSPSLSPSLSSHPQRGILPLQLLIRIFHISYHSHLLIGSSVSHIFGTSLHRSVLTVVVVCHNIVFQEFDCFSIVCWLSFGYQPTVCVRCLCTVYVWTHCSPTEFLYRQLLCQSIGAQKLYVKGTVFLLGVCWLSWVSGYPVCIFASLTQDECFQTDLARSRFCG